MAVIVLQPHGLGDHIFCQSLVHQLADLDHIVWPVLPHFIQGLKNAYPEINWVPVGSLSPHIENCKRDCILNGNRILPIRWADSITRVQYKDCMKSKYEMYGLDWNTWKDFTFQRNTERENDLFYNVLKLCDYAEPYRLINKRFTSNESKSVNILESKEIRNVEMRSIDGFSLFDWSKVIERASEIHTVGTSINYIIELLELKAKEVNLYKRLPDENHYQNYDYILKRHSYIYN
jgi:hypothetical protein